MVKTNTIIVALLAGVGFTALLALLLNLPSLLFVIPASLLLAPGGIVGALFSKAHAIGSPLPMLVADSAIYSTLAYGVLRWWLRLDIARLKLIAFAAILPVIVLVYFACLPSASPLWPRGMSQLAEQEKSLRDGLPVGSSLGQALEFLKGRGIEPYEESVKSQQEIPRRNDPPILVRPGDRLVSARIKTDAGQFPCGYAIEVALVFDSNDTLRESDIDRLQLCP